MHAVVLGCGTSHGVPMIGCTCAVCTSSDPKNKRTRSGIVIQSSDSAVLVDAPPELRLQLVREKISAIDAVVLTHSHADHIMGLDDVRRINELTRRPMPVYARPSVLADIRRVFDYAFVPPEQDAGGLPSYELLDAGDRLQIGDMSIELFDVLHGRLPVLAVKVNWFAYLTDVSEIPAQAREKLKGLQTLILDATRIAPHPSHLHLDQAVELAQALKPERTYLTHLAHDYDYESTNRRLPKGIELSYDGLRVEID